MNRMLGKLIAGVLAGALALSPAAARKSDQAEVQLKAAIQKEVVDGNLKAAIEQYRKIIATYVSNRAVAAKALVRMGECYEKLRDAEARKAYERVVRDFADQTEAVAAARARLAVLGGAQPDTGIVKRRVGVYPGLASEGSYASSPSLDGRHMAITNLDSGDLELCDLGSGKVKLVKDGEGAFFPVLSPDGNQIVYAHHSGPGPVHTELRVIGIDGSKMRVLVRGEGQGRGMEFGPLDWSPDGKQILVWAATSLALVSTSDGSLKPLGSPVHSFHARFSPDGRHIVYDLRPAAAYGDKASRSSIFLITANGSREVPLVEGTANCSSPVWTPDGRKVVFVSDRSGKPDLWSIRVVDGKPQGSPELLTSTDGSDQLMGFTQDGSLYLASRNDQRDVYMADLDPGTGKVTSEPKRISGRFVGRNTGPLRWSPDGRLLAYLRRGTDATRLVIHTVATGEEREVPGVVPLLVSLGDYLAWFPDGRSLLVMESPARREFIFHRVDIETGKPQATFEVPNEMRGKSSRLSRDGKTLFYARSDGGETQVQAGKQIYVLRLVAHELASGAEKELYRTKSIFPGIYLALSGDGRQLAVTMLPVDANVKQEDWWLVAVPVDGGAPHEVRRLEKGFRGLDSLAWTADDRHVLVAQPDSQLWSFPIDGGEPQRCGLTMQGLWMPSVSPDGRRIAFSAGESQDQLWVVKNLQGR